MPLHPWSSLRRFIPTEIDELQGVLGERHRLVRSKNRSEEVAELRRQEIAEHSDVGDRVEPELVVAAQALAFGQELAARVPFRLWHTRTIVAMTRHKYYEAAHVSHQAHQTEKCDQ